MEEVIGGMRLLHQAGQLGAKQIDLPIVENLNSSQISLLVEPGDLLIGKPEFLPFLQVFQAAREIARSVRALQTGP